MKIATIANRFYVLVLSHNLDASSADIHIFDQ